MIVLTEQQADEIFKKNLKEFHSICTIDAIVRKSMFDFAKLAYIETIKLYS